MRKGSCTLYPGEVEIGILVVERRNFRISWGKGRPDSVQSHLKPIFSRDQDRFLWKSVPCVDGHMWQSFPETFIHSVFFQIIIVPLIAEFLSNLWLTAG